MGVSSSKARKQIIHVIPCNESDTKTKNIKEYSKTITLSDTELDTINRFGRPGHNVSKITISDSNKAIVDFKPII
jgi:hypothetical protein